MRKSAVVTSWAACGPKDKQKSPPPVTTPMRSEAKRTSLAGGHCHRAQDFRPIPLRGALRREQHALGDGTSALAT